MRRDPADREVMRRGHRPRGARHMSARVAAGRRAILPRPTPVDDGGVADQAPCLAEDPLSDREREVARLVVLGCRKADVAARLGISGFTVGKHLEHIYVKLGIHTRRELAGHALRLGIV